MKQSQQHKLLFLPFMQIASGHHQVAHSLMVDFQRQYETIRCDKVDLLSYSYGSLEKVVSSVYLAWIKYFPSSYHWLYHRSVYKNLTKRKRSMFYGSFFIYFFKRLIAEFNPDILICTHALPSNVASRLKRNDQLDRIVINVYTDYFVNRLWGLQGIDYHFAPTTLVKNHLLEKGVPERSIIMTGIPVHPVFRTKSSQERRQINLSILVTGGNLGVGGMESILANTQGHVHYYVLCGQNTALYNQLLHNPRPHVTPFPYIKPREQMNQLYDQVDAVLTKPGGVTISECLMKRKPIFVYDPLPGQETINVEQLLRLGLIMPVASKNSFEQQIVDYFNNQKQQVHYQQSIETYHRHLEKRPFKVVMDELLRIGQ
ncbi:MAG TPA: UDP-glucuronosyltransferase [Bacillota bacterium]|nr:UDP-glucuronosyltransferase [Bacillota bacterium]